jgi:hypothetical protein
MRASTTAALASTGAPALLDRAVANDFRLQEMLLMIITGELMRNRQGRLCGMHHQKTASARSSDAAWRNVFFSMRVKEIPAQSSVLYPSSLL